MYKVIFNIDQDFDELLIKEFVENQFDIEIGIGSEELRYRYFNLKRRLIKAEPRKVFIDTIP